MAERSSEIVVGIDFGTTVGLSPLYSPYLLTSLKYSGVSWAVNGGSRTVRLINDWPRSRVAHQPKVPSSISYENGRPQKWGYAVTENDESFRWIKILLETERGPEKTVQQVKDSNRLLGRINKSAEDVVADYLRLLWDYTMADIRNTRDDYDEMTFSLRVILTVPAMWSPAAKEKTRRAAVKAGLPSKITLVTEPEAAALITLRERADDGLLKVTMTELESAQLD